MEFDQVCREVDELAQTIAETITHQNALDYENLLRELMTLRSQWQQDTEKNPTDFHYAYLKCKQSFQALKQASRSSRRQFLILAGYQFVWFSVLMLFACVIYVRMPLQVMHASLYFCLWWSMIGSVSQGCTMLFFSNRVRQVLPLSIVIDSLLKPLMGAMAGVIVWLSVEAGLTGGQVHNLFFLAILSFAAGYSERTFFLMLEKKLNASNLFKA